jgi:hypothetical protein
MAALLALVIVFVGPSPLGLMYNEQCAVCMLVIMRGGIGGSAASYAQLLWCLVGDEQAAGPNQLAGRW